MKNYSSARITGSTNHGASSITDHAASEQHNVAMLRPRPKQVKAARVPIAERCPITTLLHVTSKKLMQEKLIEDLTFAM